MGVEWDLGCERCLRFLWLGSQKPMKWGGFQVGDGVVRRFMGLHDHRQGCTLRLTNDGCPEAPWEEESGAANQWQEDVLSRSFWDSWTAQGLDCAHCGAKGPRAPASDTAQASISGLLKNRALWLCGERCFVDYCAYQATERDRRIYDSSDDVITFAEESLLAVACLDCRVYLVVDGKDDGLGTLRDMEQLALFLCEHIGNDISDQGASGHRLAASHITQGEEAEAPWQGPGSERWHAFTD